MGAGTAKMPDVCRGEGVCDGDAALSRGELLVVVDIVIASTAWRVVESWGWGSGKVAGFGWG